MGESPRRGKGMIETLRNLPRPRDFKSLDDAQRYSEDLLGALERWQVEVPDRNATTTDLFVRPETYGAKGDGVHDDTTAIQAAIDACLAATPPKSLTLSSVYALASSVNIDRLVDTQTSDLRIVGLGSKSGFRVTTAINMFSSTLVTTTAPRSEHIIFEDVYFECSEESLAAYVLNGDKFLRVKFINCRFYRIHLLTTALYTQSIALTKCAIKWCNAGGVFYNCAASYDISFEGNLIEWTGTIYRATGLSAVFRFINNLVEGLSASPIITTGTVGCTIGPNYFEENIGPHIDLSGGANYSLSLFGNGLGALPAQITDPSYSAVALGTFPGTIVSIGNQCNARLYDVDLLANKNISSLGDQSLSDTIDPTFSGVVSCKTINVSDLTSGYIPYHRVPTFDYVVNGGFDTNVEGWSASDCTLDSVGGCLEITRTAGDAQAASQTITGLVIGEPYIFSFSVKSGTSGNETFYVSLYRAPDWLDAQGLVGKSSGTLKTYTVNFVATAVSYYIVLHKYTATPGTMLFDAVSVMEKTGLADSPLSTDGTDVACSGKINVSGVQLIGGTGTTKLFSHQADDLADDGTVTLPDATSGMVLVSCNAEAGTWLVQTDGTVTKISGSTNTAAADTDANLCVYDGGTGAIVKNRLNATGEIRIVYYYN